MRAGNSRILKSVLILSSVSVLVSLLGSGMQVQASGDSPVTFRKVISTNVQGTVFKLAISSDGRQVFAGTSGPAGSAPRVFRLDTSTGAVAAQGVVPVSGPSVVLGGLAVDPAGSRLWASLGSTVTAFDATTLNILGVWEYRGDLFEALVTSPGGERVFGLTWGGPNSPSRLVAIDAASGAKVGQVVVSSPERLTSRTNWVASNRLVIDPAGQSLFVVPNDSRDLVVVNASDLSIRTRIAAGQEPTSVALAPTANLAFVSDPSTNALYQFETASLQQVGVAPLAGRCPSWLTSDTLGERAVVSNPCGGEPDLVFNPRSGQRLGTGDTSSVLAVWISPDGTRLYTGGSAGVDGNGSVTGFELLTRQQVKARTARLLPGQPSDVRTATQNDSVTITWQAPATRGRGEATKYVVTAQPGGATCTTPKARRSCTFSGLTRGRAYAFSVVASNKSGAGPRAVSRFVVIPNQPGPQATPKPEPTFS